MVTLGGVQLTYLPFFGAGATLSFDSSLGIPVTIVLTLLTINAMNFIDGLDGLAAGVTTIAALAFFVFSYHLGKDGFTASGLAAHPARGGPGRHLHRLPAAQLLPGQDLHGRLRLDGGRADPRRLGHHRHHQRRPAGVQQHPRRRCRCSCRCSSRSRCWRCPSSTCCSPWCAASAGAAPRSRRTSSTCTTACSRSGTATGARCSLLYFWSALIAFAGVGLSFQHQLWLVVIGLSCSSSSAWRCRSSPACGPAGGGARQARRRGIRGATHDPRLSPAGQSRRPPG